MCAKRLCKAQRSSVAFAQGMLHTSQVGQHANLPCSILLGGLDWACPGVRTLLWGRGTPQLGLAGGESQDPGSLFMALPLELKLSLERNALQVALVRSSRKQQVLHDDSINSTRHNQDDVKI